MTLGIDVDRVTGWDRLLRRARCEGGGVGDERLDLWLQSCFGEESRRVDIFGQEHQIADERRSAVGSSVVHPFLM
ncbi:hypothetical protein [Streptomyces sp. NPDC001286]